MAKTKGPLFSLDASGTVAKTIVFSRWKGQSYVRRHQIPYNPQSAKQTNVRKAMTLLVPYWQTTSEINKAAWEAFAKGSGISGFNIFVQRGMKAYVDQLTTDGDPASVGVTDLPPNEVWVWTEVV